MYILFKEILEINPNKAPAGQIFVQKNLFLKPVSKMTRRIPAKPTVDIVNAEPKYVYGSMYLSKRALPPVSAPRTTAAMKYLTG